MNKEEDNEAFEFSEKLYQSASKEEDETVATLSKTAKESQDNELEEELTDINASLAKQVSEEIEINTENKKHKKKWKKLLLAIGIPCASLAFIAILLLFTPTGNKLLLSFGVNISGTIWSHMTNKFGDNSDVDTDIDYIDEDDKNSDTPEIDPASITWPTLPGNGRHEDGVYNILLLGEEAIGMEGGRGHTDVIVIATMNTKTRSIKLTSLMRDTYVQIPGFNDNKLNVAYAKGGLDLLYETIALNYDIKLDGCVKVDFSNFEKIIDRIGGISIILKQGEAQYLNSTNYISNKKYRNVKAGLNYMNGNQALGYSRIRKISTITGNNNDYGRTDRHRIILNAIFDKIKSKSKTELATMMVDFLPMITTDIDKQNFQVLLNSFIDMGMNTQTIEQLRLPVDGAFQENKVRGMDVIVPDIKRNIEEFHHFIFDDPLPTVPAQVTVTPSN